MCLKHNQSFHCCPVILLNILCVGTFFVLEHSWCEWQRQASKVGAKQCYLCQPSLSFLLGLIASSASQSRCHSLYRSTDMWLKDARIKTVNLIKILSGNFTRLDKKVKIFATGGLETKCWGLRPFSRRGSLLPVLSMWAASTWIRASTPVNT